MIAQNRITHANIPADKKGVKMENFTDISWSANMKKAYRIAFHNAAINRQNRIFERNAMLRQKIVGCLISLISMAIWIWFTLYDVVLILWGYELFPFMILGFYMMLTNKRLFKKFEEDMRRERRNGTGYMED